MPPRSGEAHRLSRLLKNLANCHPEESRNRRTTKDLGIWLIPSRVRGTGILRCPQNDRPRRLFRNLSRIPHDLDSNSVLLLREYFGIMNKWDISELHAYCVYPPFLP